MGLFSLVVYGVGDMVGGGSVRETGHDERNGEASA